MSHIARFGEVDSLDAERPGGEELRLFDWSELTARLNAARDLRLVLRRDTDRTIRSSAHDFADAAARYFRTKEESQTNVNPVALEHCKGSPGIIPEHGGYPYERPSIRKHAAKGDARED